MQKIKTFLTQDLFLFVFEYIYETWVVTNENLLSHFDTYTKKQCMYQDCSWINIKYKEFDPNAENENNMYDFIDLE